MLLKKIDGNWYPDEAPTIKEGELVDFNAPTDVLLAEKTVEEIKVKCPACDFASSDVFDFTTHVYRTHQEGKPEVKLPETKDVVEPKFTEVKPAEVTVSEVKKAFKDMTPEEKKAWRIENLKRGREIAKAKQQAKKEAELTQETVKKTVAGTVS